MYIRGTLLCGIFLFLQSVVIAQQKPEKPTSTVESNTAVQGPVFDVGAGITPPKPISVTDPRLPKGKHTIQGTCVLSLIVDEDGRTRDVRVIRSLDKRLDQSAIDAVYQWKFEPAMKDGKSVAVRTSVEVTFVVHK